MDQIEQEKIGGAFQIWIQRKEIFLFDSFGLMDLKKFIIQDDKEIINKILFGFQKKKLADFESDHFQEQILKN